MATGYDYDATLIVYKNDGTSANYEINKSGRAGQQGYGFTVYVSFYSSEPYTREGYDFIGYKQDNVSSNPMYYPGNSVPFGFGAGGGSQTQRFYCQWRLKTYTISYNANGGTGAPASQTKTHGVNLTLSSTVPTRTNYIFQGWATSSTGTPTYQPGGSFGINASTVLYAIWKQAAATLDSVSNTAIGSNGTASWTKINEAHTYKLVLSVGVDTSVEVDNIAAGSSSVGFTIPYSWLSALPNSTSAMATATLYTYNAGTLVGSTSKSFTVSVPSTVKPSISAFTAVPHSANNTVEGWGVAVQGYSYLTLAVTATAGTGASIANIAFTGHGITQSSAATTGNTAVVTSTGTLTYNVTVTDSRGRTENATVNITVYEYANPIINSLESVRCYSNGTPSDTEGDYIKSFPIFVFSSVNGNNSLSVKKLEYRAHGTGAWTTVTTSAVSGAWTSAFGPADITKSFDVKLTVTDTVGNTFVLEVIVNSVVGYAFGLKNDRVRFGGPVRQPGFECDFPAQFDSTVDVIQRRCSATLSSAGWYRVMQTKDVSGTIIDFRIGRPYGANPAEAHKISFYIVGGGKSAFMDEMSDTNTICVDKIRVTYGGGLMYFDVHYNASSANEVLVYFDVYGKGQANGTSIAMGLESVADAPAGETVLTTYTFRANYNPTMVDIWSAVTLNYSELRKDVRIQGGMVHILIETYFDSYQADHEYTLGSVSSPYRPLYLVFFTGHTVDANFNPKGLVTFIIYPDGTMTVRINNTNGNYLILNATYPIF